MINRQEYGKMDYFEMLFRMYINLSKAIVIFDIIQQHILNLQFPNKLCNFKKVLSSMMPG